MHSYGATWIISEGSKSIGETIVRDGYDSFFADQGRKVPVYKSVFRTPEQGQFVEQENADSEAEQDGQR